MKALLEGYLIGLGMVIFIGPVFFTLLQSTLEHGRRAGFAIAFGVFFSDIVVVALCYLGAQKLALDERYQFWVGLIGSLILFFLGIKYFLKSNKKIDKSPPLNAKGISSFFLNGFAVNFINPFVFTIWIGIIVYVKSKFPDTADQVTYLAGSLLGIITTDGLKVLLAAKLQKYVVPLVLVKIYWVIGGVLICFGLRLLYIILKM